MGKYTIREEWPDDLKVAAANVIRAKLEKKWRKRNALTCETVKELKFCQDAYISACHNLQRAKVMFEDMKLIYTDEI